MMNKIFMKVLPFMMATAIMVISCAMNSNSWEIILGIVIIIIVVSVLRSFWTWFLKLDEIVKNQEKVIQLMEEIKAKL